MGDGMSSPRDEVVTWRETSAELPADDATVLGLYDDIQDDPQRVWSMYFDHADHVWRNTDHLRCEAPVMWAPMPKGPPAAAEVSA